MLLTLQFGECSQYDALPLRAPLANEPHFQTSQGREGHRFADAEINRYRLYDFYTRQAEYQLGQTNAPQILLPYPGLEGGRRGHWGNTNEKLSSTVLNRTQEPRYHRLLNRGPHGDQYVCIGKEPSQSVCLFKASSPSMSQVMLNAELRAPVHAFAHQVDRYGFDMQAQGDLYLIGDRFEWYNASEKAVKVTSHGYHLHNDKVIFRRQIDNHKVLDWPSVSRDEDTAVYTRQWEWLDDAPRLRFLLPVSGKEMKNAKVSIRRDGSSWLAELSAGNKKLNHRITSSAPANSLSLVHQSGRIWVIFPEVKKGTLIKMESWLGTLDSHFTPKTSEPAILSEFLGGATRYFTQSITVKGTLNADPAASGTAYEFDEIPVPDNNPYGVPMTTCGLTFSDDGCAYISTLVGDIWKVSGLNHSLEKVQWQRFASGLNSPLGLEMADGILYVLTQHQILKLHDLNNDGEADFIEPFTQIKLPPGRLHDLTRDDDGNFYCSHVRGIHKISPDGSSISIVSTPCRNPLGMGVRGDGLALSDSSEGNQSNGTCSIFESIHPENEQTVAKNRRILYLPRGVDNSPGSRIFTHSERFGPLGSSILGLSYGTGRIYQIIRDTNNGTPQAAMHMLPGEFSSGTARLETNPKDGQVYVVGLDGWGDFAVNEGCFTRIRYTGKKSLLPVSWKAKYNGLLIGFNQAIDPGSIKPERFFLQQWNYRDSHHTYGSAEYSVRQPEQIGHDRVKIQSIHLSEDRKSIFINAPDLLPAMCSQLYGSLTSKDGATLQLNLFATINQLSVDNGQGDLASKDKIRNLKVPYYQSNGDTYAVITGFFDKRAGRAGVQRPVGPVVKYQSKELNYAWVKDNIIMKNTCIACHGPGSQHDFSSYASLMKSVDLKNPGKSHLLGMLKTGSMPPFPMPTVAPEMQKALETWIQNGAPE
ncbi:hypothetical protein HW115_04430 [Verrucomicrobiaceae bacterium N1E253]|uniref:Uncharacterized protein n=1 Tax=Oceaniferula marina TaxID=2748318 RepID=A0A851GD25_9BACT|nr:hypothetical protein [Oceaniferula marina]NWK54842.1 hypothetical protein [Oceaniferula marina]